MAVHTKKGVSACKCNVTDCEKTCACVSGIKYLLLKLHGVCVCVCVHACVCLCAYVSVRTLVCMFLTICVLIDTFVYALFLQFLV